MLLDDDPADWRERPREPHRRSGSRRSTAAPAQSEQLVGRTHLRGRLHLAGRDVLGRRPHGGLPAHAGRRWTRSGSAASACRWAACARCHLAALDDRIKAAVVVGWMASFPAQLERHVRNTIGHTKVVPGLYRHLDYPDVASLAMPTPLLVINGSKDGLFDPRRRQGQLRQARRLLREGGRPRADRARVSTTRRTSSTPRCRPRRGAG